MRFVISFRDDLFSKIYFFTSFDDILPSTLAFITKNNETNLQSSYCSHLKSLNRSIKYIIIRIDIINYSLLNVFYLQ